MHAWKPPLLVRVGNEEGHAVSVAAAGLPVPSCCRCVVLRFWPSGLPAIRDRNQRKYLEIPRPAADSPWQETLLLRRPYWWPAGSRSQLHRCARTSGNVASSTTGAYGTEAPQRVAFITFTGRDRPCSPAP